MKTSMVGFLIPPFSLLGLGALDCAGGDRATAGYGGTGAVTTMPLFF